MMTWRKNDRDARMSPRAVDTVLAAVVAIVLSAIIAVSQDASGAAPTVMPYVFAVGIGAVLLLRRQLPVGVLVLSVLATFAYYTLGYPPIGVALPVMGTLYSAAERGLTRWAIGAGAVVFLVSLFFRLRDDPQPLEHVVGTDAATNVALIAAAIALGYGVRNHRQRIMQQDHIARLTLEQSERDAQLRLQTERERISRELHDTLGHSLTVIALHASVGTEAVGRDDRSVTVALDQVRNQSTTSLRELRSMVRLLRTDAEGHATHHVPSLAKLQTIIDEADAAGIEVTTDITLPTAPLPTAVEATAYRVIQESLTNVLRHARASTALVRAAVEDGMLRVVVSDDGQGAVTDGGTEGSGITGMTERVRLLGGSLTTRTTPGTGFTVEAEIPARLTT